MVMTENTFTRMERRDHEDERPHSARRFLLPSIHNHHVRTEEEAEEELHATHTLFNSLTDHRWETYRHGGDGGDQRVDDDRRRFAVVLGSRIRLGVSFVKAEEALDVHGERVRVLKVVSQQNGPCHDDQLEIKHSGSSVRDGNPRTERARESEEETRKKKRDRHG